MFSEKLQRAWMIPGGVALSIAVAVIGAAIIFIYPALVVEAASPTNGTLSPSTGASVGWAGTAPGPSNPGDPAGLGVDTCIEGINCETYTLTLSGATSDWAGKQVHVKISWLAGVSDYDLYVYKDSLTGAEVGSSAGGAPNTSEEITFDPSQTGAGVYVVHIIYFTAVAVDEYQGVAEVIAAPPPPAPPPASIEQPPTYSVFTDPQNRSFAEPSIGANWLTGAIMVLVNTFDPVKITFNDSTAPATATWTSKPKPINQPTSLDPILFTDSKTGRTFSSQLAVRTSFMAYTDNDGDTWNISQGGGISSGVDHQTVGGGPFRPMQGINPALGAYPNAVYYASQDIAAAEAAVSLDGGVTFGPAIPMYTIADCGGLHGHIKVAPDGTAYVPNKNCNGNQAVVVSENNGLTWSVRRVPGTSGGQTDPSVGIGTDGTVYFGFANGDGRAMVTVSRDKGLTWSKPYDAGYSQGIKNTVFAEVAAGDGDRAAFYFLGTTTGGGNAYANDKSFAGAWYPFIATTYDRGQTWVTVNASPNDPVQRGPVCTAGTTCSGGTRNLLDFNDITVDKEGRVVAVFADGCTSAGCIAGDNNGDGVVDGNDGDYTDRANVIRSATGKRLFAAWDPPAFTTLEENASQIAYTDGWHQINDSDASAGHFRADFSSSPSHSASLAFNVTGATGAVSYYYAKSPKGGSADVYLDGSLKGSVSFYGASGSTRAPEFGANVRYGGLSSGSHTLELRNIRGAVYVDKFVIESGNSSASPSVGPGATSTNSGTIGLTSLLSSITAGTSTKAISIVAEATPGVPFQIVAINPSGLSIATASASPSGIAVLNVPVSQFGTYTIKTVNLSVGPIQVWTATTPLVSR